MASWGGYSFIINLLPIHCLGCIFLGRLNSKLYVAYAPFIILGTIEAASIPVVGFNAVLMSEHFGSFLAFGVLHAALAMQYIKVSPDFVCTVNAVMTCLILGIRYIQQQSELCIQPSTVMTFVVANNNVGWTVSIALCVPVVHFNNLITLPHTALCTVQSRAAVAAFRVLTFNTEVYVS